jgi:hypothetical protein
MSDELRALDLAVGVAMLFVLPPTLVLAHEMGHAIEAIRRGRRPVVVVGREPSLLDLRFRRFDLRLHPVLELTDAESAEMGADVAGWCVFDRTEQGSTT